MAFKGLSEAGEYSPRDGDTLERIAERESAAGNPLTWQELARFNWGTDDPVRIEGLMRDELGARVRSNDGGFAISADDSPRTPLKIPTRFRQGGLATGRTHDILVLRKATPEQFLGCCSLPSVVFALESSFIRPSVVDHLKTLGMLAESRPEARIMVYGHTDASGDELYNKKLSERRAWSAYAFVVNDAEAWETLYNHPDENWGVAPIQEILADQGHYQGEIDGDLGPGTRGAMRAFLGLPDGASVSNDSDFRLELFRAYMTSKHDVKITPDRFLESGYMGCGEFNPLEEREPQDETNRRVTFFLFHEDRPPNMPCAFADTGPCERQMVSLDQRHTASFTCSFYDSLSRRCGTEIVRTLRIRLFDPFGMVMSGTPCTVSVGSHSQSLTSDDTGYVETRVAGSHERAVVEWGADDPAGEDGETLYRHEIFLNYEQGATREALALRRLFNLGYSVDPSLPAEDQVGAVQMFQLHYKERFALESISGELDDATLSALEEVHDNCDPNDMTEEE